MNTEAGKEKTPRLSPRQKKVLELLLQSQNRKQIASQLDISINTVSGYVKEVYRHFGVRSHAQLFHHFYEGDGSEKL